MINFSAYFDNETGIIAVYFNGQETDWLKVAQAMAYFLLQDLYFKRPSRWIGAGLAEYIAYKSEKENAKSLILDNLEYINWLYDRGEWEHAMDLFTYWASYERMGFINPYSPVARVFYLRAWSLIHFFLEGGDPFYRDFFRQYLQYEKRDGFQTYASVYNYFREHLTQEQIHELDNQWGKYVLTLTFEKM